MFSFSFDSQRYGQSGSANLQSFVHCLIAGCTSVALSEQRHILLILHSDRQFR